MITPEYLDKIIEETQKQVTYMQTQILRKMCDRIYASFTKKEKNIFIPTTIKEMHQLMDLGMLEEDIQMIVEKALPDIQEEIKKAFLQSAKEISDYNTDFAKEIVETINKYGEHIDIEIPQYEKIGLPRSAAELNMTAEEIRKLEQIYNRTKRYADNLCHTLPALGNEEYVDICDRAFLRQKAGEPIGLLIKDAIKEASANGIKFVSYDSGHVDTVEVALARAVRSGINKANAEIVLTRAGEMGVGHVLVSEHFGARVTKYEDYTNHAMWQGKVYKIDWNSEILKKYDVSVPKEEKNFAWLRKMRSTIKSVQKESPFPDFVNTCGYGELLGICGVNCRHTFSMFFPEFQSVPEKRVGEEKNEKFYEMTQRQREMERSIRKTKTELFNLNDKTGPEIEERRNFLLKLQDRQMEKYMDFIDQNGLKLDDWRLQIYKGYDKSIKNNQLLQIDSRKSIGYNASSINNINLPFNEEASFEVHVEGVSEKANRRLSSLAKKITKEGHKNEIEYAFAVDRSTGKLMAYEQGRNGECMTDHFFSQIDKCDKKQVVLLHNHTNNKGASYDDVNTMLTSPMAYASIMSCNNGEMRYFGDIIDEFTGNSVYDIILQNDVEKAVNEIIKKRPDYDMLLENTGAMATAREEEMGKYIISRYFRIDHNE